MSRDINIEVAVAVATAPDRTVVEVTASGGDERMRADVTALILTHLDMLWARLAVADRIGTVERRRQDA